MTQTELIADFPSQNSISERVLLVGPDMFDKLIGLSVHECRVFLLVTRGDLLIRTGTAISRLEANSFVDMLIWEPIKFIDASNDLQAWCLLPNYIFTNESLNDLKPADSESFKDRHAIPILPLEPPETGILGKQLMLLQSALHDTGHFYRNELCRTYFRSFMLEVGNLMLHKRKEFEETDTIENRQDTILRSFLKLVWRYYTSEHNVDFYAEKLCISSKHLSRVVREKLGKTPYAVIRDELLQRAAYLLKDTKMSIQNISSELHFSETAAFCKFFKKHNGLPPTSFRNLSMKKQRYY